MYAGASLNDLLPQCSHDFLSPFEP